MEKIKSDILRKYPSAKTTIETFDNGAAVLDVRLEPRLFSCSFIPSRGYGIDEVKDDGGLTSIYSHATSDESGAIEVLFRLIEAQASFDKE